MRAVFHDPRFRIAAIVVAVVGFILLTSIITRSQNGVLLRPAPTEDCPYNADNPFGQADPIYASLGYNGHPGIDFGCPVGTPIVASADGVVLFAGDGGSTGIMVEIQHEHGRTRYLHLSDLQVSVTDEVVTGDQIGLSGETGLAFGPHLHYDYYPTGVSAGNGFSGRVDPLPLMYGN